MNCQCISQLIHANVQLFHEHRAHALVILMAIDMLRRWCTLLLAPNIQDLSNKVYAFPGCFNFCSFNRGFPKASRLSQAIIMKCFVSGSKSLRHAVPKPIPNRAPSSHLQEFKSVIGPGTMPPPSIQDKSSVEESI